MRKRSGSIGETNALLFEMIGLQRSNPGFGLFQFANRLTAGQYGPLYSIVLRRLRNGGRILDWGCGNGHFAHFLARRGFETHVFSLEDSPPVLRLPGPGACAFTRGSKVDPVALPYPADFFDAVVSVGVLEHVRECGGDERASLGEIRRILKPGGAFIGYHIPNRWSWVEFLSSFFPSKHHHRWRYTSASFRALLESSGFEVQEVRHYGFLPRGVMRRCPRRAADSAAAALFYDGADRLLATVLPFLCTNLLAIGVKPWIRGDARSGD